jgi:hypothetical protein
MGCSCCSSEISKDNSFFSNMRKKRIKQYVHNNNNSTTSKLRIDTIGSVNSINFNGVLNITYKNSNNDKTNKIESSNRIITDLNDSYNSKNTNKNNNKNIINNYNTEPIIEEIQKKNYNIISIKKKENKNTEVTRKNPNKSSRQEQMLHLLALFIKGKTGLINCCKTKQSNANELLLLKGLSPNSLDNLRINTVNSNLKKQRKIFKNQKLPDINSECFIDDLFPPNKDSILGLKKGVPVEKSQERLNKLRKEFVFDVDNIIWLRAEEIFNYQHYSIFVNDISIDDVRQGYLGNCYFMSSLAAMTNMPQLICQLFRSFQIKKNGCYEIGLNIEGEWQIVLLDDYFPCSKKTRIPIFAKPNGPELWAMLLEKAWAKINGGYLNITGGYASEVLSVFTSFPIETFDLLIKDIDIIWKKLKNAFEDGHIITCCSKFDNEIEKYGLISGHTFTVTNLVEGNINDQYIRLIRLRNPWGYKEWTGKWSDHSELWTEEAKKELNVNLNIEDDGEFYMSFEDFFNYFLVVDVCRVTNPQCVKSFKIPFNYVYFPNVFELQIFNKTHIIISALKKNYRFHRTIAPNSELVITLILIKKTNDKTSEKKFQYIDSTKKNEGNPFLDLELTVGYYLLYVHCNYDNATYDKIRKVNMYISANKYFFFYYKNIDKNFHLLKYIIYEMNKTKIDSSSTENNEPLTLTSNKFEKTTFGYLIIKNNSNKDLRLNITNQCENYELFYPFGFNTLNIEALLYPGQYQVIIGIRQKYYQRYNFNLVLLSHQTPKEVPIFSIIQNNLFSGRGTDKETDQSNNNNTTNNKFKFRRANFIKEGTIYNDYVDILKVEKFFENVPDKPIDQNDYDFIFKKINIDNDEIIENIDYKKNAEDFFRDKYPKEVEIILNDVEPVNDGEEVIFREIFNYGNSYYIGEWKTKEELIKHGRGLLVNLDGTSYLGQFRNDLQDGRGKLLFNKVEYIDINWKEGKMDGVGILKRADGSIKNVYYKNGIKMTEKEYNKKNGLINIIINSDEE